MSDMSIDRVSFLLKANRKAGRRLQEQFQRHGQEHDKAKAEQARLVEIAATQRKHAEEAVDVVMRAGAVNLDRAWKIVNALLDAGKSERVDGDRVTDHPMGTGRIVRR